MRVSSNKVKLKPALVLGSGLHRHVFGEVVPEIQTGR